MITVLSYIITRCHTPITRTGSGQVEPEEEEEEVGAANRNANNNRPMPPTMGKGNIYYLEDEEEKFLVNKVWYSILFLFLSSNRSIMHDLSYPHLLPSLYL